MGLSEVKSRRKIDKDPNNTKWARDTNSFGQKILRSQGWEPGQYLGAKDAAQAEHYTAANQSYVRVALKDDMLGLGFKQAKEEQVTGMNAFQDMLARLNGKSEEAMNKEKEARMAVQSSLYCDSKFGPMRFVRGGWLVGDQEGQESPVERLKREEEDKKDVVLDASKEKPKKRKAEEVSDSSLSSEDEKAQKKRRKEERKAARKAEKDQREPEASKDSTASGSEEKRKFKSKNDVPIDTHEEAQTTEDRSKVKKKSKKDRDHQTEDSEDKASKTSRKRDRRKATADDTVSDLEKAARKEKKRLKKEKKRAEGEKEKKDASKSGSSQPSSTSTPAGTGTSTPTGAGSGTSTPALRGHHAVRSKWIASKRMATMDDAALNQIFMIKAPSS